MKNFSKTTFIIIGVFISLTMFGQSRSDTIFSSNSDTMTVRVYNKNGKIIWENIYFNDKIIFNKFWYYNKNSYGFIMEDERKIKPNIKYRKEFSMEGKPIAEGSLIGNKRQGKYKTYHQNGKIQCDCNFNNGKEDSIQKIYYENGNIQVISNFKNGKEDGIETYYFKNGQIWSERLYKDGKLLEVLTNYDKDGISMEKGNLKDGNGTLLRYDENGNLELIEHFKKGKHVKTEKKNTQSGRSKTLIYPFCALMLKS